MKKIIGALALASLTLGIASADVSFTLNYRTQMAAFSRVMTAGTKAPDNAKEVLYRTHMFKHTGYGSASDNFSIKVSNDIAGATFRVDPNATGNFGSDYGKLKEYNGYIKIGNFTVSAGLFDGKMNNDYQLKSDADASNLGGESFAAYKLGSIYSGAITTQVDDITSFSGSQRLTGILTYNANLGDAKLTVDAAAIGLGHTQKKADDTEEWVVDTYSTDVKTGFALRLNAKLSDGLSTQFIIKKPETEKTAMALHVQPKIGNLTLTLGGALGLEKGALTEYNADLRLYFKAGALSITSMNTISALTEDASAYNALNAKGKSAFNYAKHVGAYYCGKDGAVANAANTVSNRAMWNMLAFRLQASDSLALMLQVGDIIGFKSAKGTFSDNFGIEAFVAPGLQIYAGKNCSIATCARIGFSQAFLNSDKIAEGGQGEWGTDRGVTSLLVPVVLRVKL